MSDSAWKGALAGALVEAGAGVLTSQIASRNVVEQTSQSINNVDPEYQKYLKEKARIEQQKDYDAYADTKIAEYLDENSKSKGQSKILNTSLFGGGSIIALWASTLFGVSLSPEEIAFISSAIALGTNVFNYYFRRYKTTKLIK